jgi:hypothetical protein
VSVQMQQGKGMTQEAACTRAPTAEERGKGVRDARARPGGEIDGSCGSGYRLGGRTVARTQGWDERDYLRGRFVVGTVGRRKFMTEK